MSDLRRRLEALEAAAAHEQQVAPYAAVQPPRPSFETVLAGLDLVLNGLRTGKCDFAYTAMLWEDGCPLQLTSLRTMAGATADEHEALWPWCVFVERWVYGIPAESLPRTAAAYAAWLGQYRRMVAFIESRTDDELAALALAEETDPLFWSADQRAAMDLYARLVEEET